MRWRLLQNRARLEVPPTLTYFDDGDRCLVVNPDVGARCLLDRREFGVLRALAQAPAGSAAPLPEDDATERTLAKLVLSWVVYFNGNRPSVAIAEPPLRMAYYAITDGCNLRCPYCYASSEKCLPGELDTAESIDLVSQIAELGCTTMVFTGGEPMLRRDLFEIVAHARRCGMRTNVITNATMIRKPETARRFAELFDAVTISLDGGTAETHDRTRGPGAFEKTRQAIRLLNAEGVAPAINHIVTSGNVAELEDFAEFMNGIDVQSVRLMNHNDLGRGVDDDDDFGWSDHLRVQQLIWTSPSAGKLRADGPKPVSPCSVKGNCGMGGNEIYINSLGDVYPCKLITDDSYHAGNIRRSRLADIFAHPVLSGMRRSTVFGGDYHADCEKCYIKANCGGGCRAAHMSESGDIRDNSRHLCRILRHGIATQLWQEAGLGLAEIAERDQEITVPRLVGSGAVHPVFDQWETYAPSPRRQAKVNRLSLSITPVTRRSDDVVVHH